MEILVVTRKLNIRTWIHMLPLPKKHTYDCQKILTKKFACASLQYMHVRTVT
jgi:hypothetical protein